MYTVKFIKHYIVDDETKPSRQGSAKHTNSISCPRYSVWEHSDGGLVIYTHRDHESSDPGSPHTFGQDFDECFVENAAGKTVASYRRGLELSSEGALSPALREHDKGPLKAA